ncbi:hypothetical protein P152DRAFT_121147 [Eremomyces bilateralis CBS 781.70]|uniref:Cullin N-terminal domain-containing protein n=1 Tax=Eremomyces bilateralis CBS 781.70 TaxID=1392243 RepID=A0A6G1GE99_9PEZI|nr:uncharacterized protein P152DRAFT_121147 [Eremomyces bilateralis CBS 781.70]KAF1816373.1 hypothetical protein P152DRAFT_121147 [Eremomyces bilateralis CBS 781.70]
MPLTASREGLTHKGDETADGLPLTSSGSWLERFAESLKPFQDATNDLVWILPYRANLQRKLLDNKRDLYLTESKQLLGSCGPVEYCQKVECMLLQELHHLPMYKRILPEIEPHILPTCVSALLVENEAIIYETFQQAKLTLDDISRIQISLDRIYQIRSRFTLAPEDQYHRLPFEVAKHIRRTRSEIRDQISQSETFWKVYDDLTWAKYSGENEALWERLERFITRLQKLGQT